MCGIAGILYRHSHRTVDPAALKAMGDSIAHRGPDAEGFFRDPGLGLVHRRLSIIDLASGNQPIANEDQSLQVVFNGEIYNYPELRERLIAKGHTFSTESDTEVIVHLYEEYGAELVTHLRGMFAFALWDRKARSLLLARDRIGLKPLYVYRDTEKVVFGSEIKAILAHGRIDRTLNAQAVDDYFAYGVIPANRSIFRHIEKLPPAHVLQLSSESLSQEPDRYWQYDPAVDSNLSEQEWLDRFAEKIHETVTAHRIADVPVGAFLSGGLDSSVIVSQLATDRSETLRTFSIGFEEARFSELPYARQVARQYGCEHFEQIVTPDAAASLDDLVHHFDEPFADSSAIPTMHVARLAREHVKVVLSGDGGDEAFGGYARYQHDLLEAGLRNVLPGWFRQIVLRRMADCWPKADWLPRPLRAKTMLTNLSLPSDRAYVNTISLCRLPLRRSLLASDFHNPENGPPSERALCAAYGTAAQDDPLGAMIATDVAMLLPDDFLTKVDRASMAVGLEVRPPFVDHELLELAAQLPSRLKIRDGKSKWILHKLYTDRLPDDITRRPKQGFEMPVDHWLRGPLREMFCDTVLSKNHSVSDLINQQTLEKMYHQHCAKTGQHGNTLWAALVLARWTERYLQGDGSPNHLAATAAPEQISSSTTG